MPAPGHQPIRNTDRQTRRESATSETAATILTSKPTLPNYQRARRRLPVRPRGRISEVHMATDAAAEIQTLLLDVAAASFGGATASADATVFEVVLGEDDRVKVAADRMAMNPWRQICALRIVSQSNRTYVGTGWFIGPAVLATAGHCVFLQDDGGWARSIRVMPAKHGRHSPSPP
jgi:hypothetical protein